jgi:hypothetical protein
LRYGSLQTDILNIVKLYFSLLSLLLLLAASGASATPRIALLSGTRCSACHVNPQGGGLRTELGFSAMNEVGLFKWSTPPEGDEALLAEPASNLMANGLIMPGIDVRVQQVKLSTTGRPAFIPMQLSPYLAILPTKELTIYGNYNIAGGLYRLRKGSSTYPGQTDWEAAIQYQPSDELPSIRAGMIQPSIGIRHEDHTVFARREVAMNGINLIPPYYNEIGAEATYEGMKWLTVNAGIFNSHNLAKTDFTLGKDSSYFTKPIYSARVMLWPQLLEEGINGELGASILTNGDSMRMINVFFGFGLSDKATFLIEGVHARNRNNRIIRNFSVMGSYHLKSWLSAHWRYEWGQTELFESIDLSHANAFLVGFEFFPFPFVEIRPEYRYFERNPFSEAREHTGQYTVQLHLFY